MKNYAKIHYLENNKILCTQSKIFDPKTTISKEEVTCKYCDKLLKILPKIDLSTKAQTRREMSLKSKINRLKSINLKLREEIRRLERSLPCKTIESGLGEP